MGQKVNPHGLRVGVNRGWDSVWYAEKNFGDLLVEDNHIRKFIKKKLYAAGIEKITISRTSSRVKVTIFTAKPGVVIGRSGQAIADLATEVHKLVASKDTRVDIDISEIKRPELSAQLVAEDIAKQLENRVTFRRAMKQAMNKTMKMGAKGIKAATAGRLGGADIARTEFYHEGTIPLQTLRANIDYGFAEAATTYGRIGVKVWIYKGEILPGRQRQVSEKAWQPRQRTDRPDRRDNRRDNRRRDYNN